MYMKLIKQKCKLTDWKWPVFADCKTRQLIGMILFKVVNGKTFTRGIFSAVTISRLEEHECYNDDARNDLNRVKTKILYVTMEHMLRNVEQFGKLAGFDRRYRIVEWRLLNNR